MSYFDGCLVDVVLSLIKEINSSKNTRISSIYLEITFHIQGRF